MTLAALALAACAAAAPPVERVKLPEGFSIAVFAADVPGARSLARGPGGTVFVGSRGEGRVYALRDADGDGRAGKARVVLEGLEQPNGVALRGADLYVAEVHRVLRYRDAEKALAAGDLPEPEVVSDALPREGHHGWKFIAFGPDGALYVPVGAPCNVCLREDARYAAVLRMDPDSGETEVYASGVRNTVGFDWHPSTRELWFTDNGRDWMGDDLPPDELNHAPKVGLHFGFPFCHGGDIPDPDFGARRPCSDFTPPARRLGAHVAALGMRFYSGTMFPEEYRGDVLIAEHGSWNRSQPAGYRIARVRMRGGKAASYEAFAEGWLRGGRAWGRPVDLLVLPDGSLLVSDDKAGAVYRVSYRKP